LRICTPSERPCVFPLFGYPTFLLFSRSGVFPPAPAPFFSVLFYSPRQEHHTSPLTVDIDEKVFSMRSFFSDESFYCLYFALDLRLCYFLALNSPSFKSQNASGFYLSVTLFGRRRQRLPVHIGYCCPVVPPPDQIRYSHSPLMRFQDRTLKRCVDSTSSPSLPCARGPMKLPLLTLHLDPASPSEGAAAKGSSPT